MEIWTRRGLARRLPTLWVLLFVGLASDASAVTERSASFAGDGRRIVVPHAAAFNPTGGITVEAWVRPASTVGCDTLVGKNFVEAWWLGLCSGRIRFYTSGLRSAADGTTALPVGEWSHVAVTFDLATRTRVYYVNGVEDLRIQNDATDQLALDDTHLGIGAEASGNFPFHGDLSEVRVWSRARSREEIRRDMVRQLSAPDLGLAAVWPLDGSPGDVYGVHDGLPVAGPSFGGPSAPPIVHEPLPIPQTGAFFGLDGFCDPGEFQDAQRLPLWFPDGSNLRDDQPDPTWARIVVDSSALRICLGPLGESRSRSRGRRR